MLQKVSSNAAYMSYMQRYPNAKVQTAALGMSLPNRPVQMPLWVVFIGQSRDEPTVTCIIEAADNNGSCNCIENSVSSLAIAPAFSQSAVFPNPLTTESLSIAFSAQVCEGEVQVHVYSSLGSEISSTTLYRHPGARIALSMRDAYPGAYSVCIDDGREREWLHVVKQ